MQNNTRTEEVKPTVPAAGPGNRKLLRKTARQRLQNADVVIRGLQQKIDLMDAYFQELATIVGVDLAAVIAAGGDPVVVMRDRILELASPQGTLKNS